jgi:hypothetical protein
MDQRRSRALPHPVGADGTTVVSNGRFYVEGPSMSSKVDDTGDTMTGKLTITFGVVGNSVAFVIEAADGTDRVRVQTTGWNGFGVTSLNNGMSLVFRSDDSSTVTTEINGSNGNISTAGSVEIDGALNHDGTTVGFYGAAPISQPAANPDTSGATLGALETEVNQIKALLRSLGLMAT